MEQCHVASCCSIGAVRKLPKEYSIKVPFNLVNSWHQLASRLYKTPSSPQEEPHQEVEERIGG